MVDNCSDVPGSLLNWLSAVVHEVQVRARPEFHSLGVFRFGRSHDDTLIFGGEVLLLSSGKIMKISSKCRRCFSELSWLIRRMLSAFKLVVSRDERALRCAKKNEKVY